MASSDLKRVGLVFTADGSADFIKTLKVVNSELQENYQEFMLVQAQWDKSTSTTKKLTDRLNYLNNAYDIQKDKVLLLSKELEELESAEKRNEVAIQKKKTALTAAKTSLQKYQNQINDVSKKIRLGTADLEDFSKKIDESGDKLISTGSKMSKLSAGIGMLGTASVVAGANFEEAMSEVKAISMASAEEMERLTEKAEYMGAITKFSATDSANAMYYMALAGWKTEDMLNGIEGVMNLAAASGEDLATVSDIVTDGLTAMGYSASESSKFADVFASTVTNSNTDVAGLGEAMKYVGSIAGTLNLEIEDVSLALGLMANVGVKGSEAGTSLRAVLQRLSTDTSGAREVLEDLGIKIFDSSGQMRDFGTIISEMRTRLADLSDEQQINIAKTVAGQTAMSGFLSIVNSADEDFNKLSTAISNSNGVAEEMSNIMLDNLKGDLVLIESQLEGIAIQVSDILIPVFRKMLSYFSDFLDWLNNLSPQVKNAIVIISAIVAAIGPLLIILGTVAKSLSNIISLYTNFIAPMISGSIGALSSVIAPVLAIVAAIALVGIAIKELWETNENFRKNVKSLISMITDTLTTAYNSVIIPIIKVLKGAISSIWPDTLQPLWTNFLSMINSVIANFTRMYNMSKPIIDSLINLLGPVLAVIMASLTASFSQTFTVLSGILQTFFNYAEGYIASLTQIFQGIIQFLTGIFTGEWSKVWEGIKNIFGGIFSRLVNLAKAPLNLIIAAINGLISGINVFISGLNKIKVPDWVPGVGGKGISIKKISSIEYLAKGGELLRGSAIVAEAGPELLTQEGTKTKVTPLTSGGGAKPAQIIDYNKLTNSIVSALLSSKFSLDDDGFVRIVKDELIRVM